MSTRRMAIVIGTVVALTMGGAMAAGADESSSPSRIDGSLRKLGRGIANIATCPGEIFRTSSIVTRKDGVVAGMTVGVLEGVWRTLVRATTGVFEVLTFPAEIPEGYGPLMMPEYVWAHGDWADSE